VKLTEPNFAAARRIVPIWLRGIPVEALSPLMHVYARSTYERKKMRRFRIERCDKRFRILALDQLRGLPLAGPSTHDCGVYFLWRGPKLLYIGKSNCIHDRLASHRRFGRVFTHATFEKLIEDLALWCEAQYIKRYRSPLNIQWSRR
jgi:hypothetical protein